MARVLCAWQVESMHSGAAVEAFTAALNRDIGMDAAAAPSISHPLPHPPGAFGVLAIDSNSTSSQLIGEWQASSQEDHTVHQTLQPEEQTDLHAQEQHSSLVEQPKHPENAKHQQQIDSRSEHENLTVQKENLSTDQHQLQKDQVVDKNLVSISQENCVQDKLEHSEDRQESLIQQLNDPHSSTSDQANNQSKQMKSRTLPFSLFIPMLRPHLDKDRSMQVDAVYAKLRSNEITKENFLRVIKNIVGDRMLRQAVQKVQTQMAARNLQISSSQHQLHASQQQTSCGAQQVLEGQSISQLHSLLSMQHQRGQTLPSAPQFVEGQSRPHHPPMSSTPIQKGQRSPPYQSQATVSTTDVQTDMGTVKSNAIDNQGDTQGHRPAQVSSTNMNVVKQEREVSLVSVQGVNKLQQDPQHWPSSLPPYAGTVCFNSHMLPRPPGTASVTSRKSQTQGSQMRQLTPQGILSPQSGATQPMNIMNASKYEMQSTVTETNRHGGALSHFTSHLSPLQSQVAWQSSASKEQKAGTLSTMSFVKQEVAEQTVEQQNKPQFSALQGSLGTMHIDQGSPTLSSSKDETDEEQPSRITFSASTSTVMINQMPGCMSSQLESGIQIRSQIPSAALPVAAGASTRTPPKKPSVGQKKPLESQGTPTPASKKQKTSGAYLDQSIEQLNDVTAVSGVNLREEEEQLLSVPKEESRASEATRRVVQEEEERLILQKGPLHKKLQEITSNCGVKNISTDVERCLSLCVEERLRAFLSNLIRVSRQRVDIEKARHRIVLTSDVYRQILMTNKRAKEEWEKKQAEEVEKLLKQNESEGTAGADAEKEKDEGERSKSLKPTKVEDDKMRTTAANVAARAAVGGDDMLSKWQLMAEQARQKREAGLEAISGALPGRTTSGEPLSNFGRTSRENQELETRSLSVASPAGGTSKFGRVIPHPKVVRSISAKDVIAVLEREPLLTRGILPSRQVCGFSLLTRGIGYKSYWDYYSRLDGSIYGGSTATSWSGGDAIVLFFALRMGDSRT